MKLRVVLGFALVVGRVVFDCFGQQAVQADTSTLLQLAATARTNSHFSLTVLVVNRPLRLWTTEDVMLPTGWTNALAEAQLRLANELRALSGDRVTLAALLKHADPKIRTLALGAIFQREDGRDLPLIATLINDSAESFPDLHDSDSAVVPSPKSDIESPQSVAHVAQAMLAYWGVLRNGRRVGLLEGELAGITTNDFARYWEKYEGREHSTSWFAVKMKRATRLTTPTSPQYQADIQRVVDEIKALPMPARSWTQLYVLCPETLYLSSSSRLATDEELITAAKALGPETLLRFLQRRTVTDDPDLQRASANQETEPMSRFILSHAGELLRPEDADALLACETSERNQSGVSPMWSIGAASVQPTRASEILRAALARETRSYVSAAGQLAGAMWRLRGPEEIDFLTDWFYTVLRTASDPMHQPQTFLWEVGAAGRTDTRDLLAALVKHPRFEFTDLTTLKEILKITNADRSKPLVSLEEISDARNEQKPVLAAWRNRLRRECGLPENAMTSSPTQAKRVLTQPAWTVPLAGALSQFVVSPDGARLAVLTDGTITIWKSATGAFEWAIPRHLTEAAYSMAFQTNGRLTVFDRAEGGRFAEWDITARQKTTQVLLTGGPHSGVDEGAYCFDGGAQRAGFAGYNHVACFDAKSGEAMWLRERGAGVRSLIALSSDGRWLASGGGSGNDRLVHLCDAGNGALLRQFDEHAGRVLALAFSPDGRGIVTASSADGVRLWDVETGKRLREFSCRVPASGIGAPCFSPDGRWLALMDAADRDGASRIVGFNAETGEMDWEIQIKPDDPIGPLAFAPDGKTFYTGARRLEAWVLK